MKVVKTKESMATYYHYTDADSLVKIVTDNLLLSSEGSGLSAAANESVFFTKKVNFVDLGGFVYHSVLCVQGS